jgi:hypothetical protein
VLMPNGILSQRVNIVHQTLAVAVGGYVEP